MARDCGKVFLLLLFFLSAMWFIGFLLHEMAFGLLSVFLPLYITGQLGGSLTELGVMIAVANLVAVPFSFFWGYLSDETKRYRLYILLSFSVVGILLFLFSLTSVIAVLIVLYAVIAVFHVAHEAPKNVLISEYYSRPDWERSFASYEAFTELGWLTGLILGFVLSAFGVSSLYLILLCSALNLVAFAVSVFSVKDPLLIFERRLVAIERGFDFAHQGFSLATKALDGEQIKEKLRNESATIFCLGLLLFSLATSMMFTPLPVFFSSSLSLPQSLIFGIYVFNNFGTFVGYWLAGKRSPELNEKAVVRRALLVRTVFPLVLVLAAVWYSTLTLTFAVLSLMIMGAAYGFFLIATLSLSMELIPEGKSGAFNALIGLGGALGCFLGTYAAQSFGFPWLFAMSSIVFLPSYIAFKMYAK